MSKIASTPPCKMARSWVVARVGRTAFAPFTGQDSHAFSMFVHAVELYLHGDAAGRNGALAAMRGAHSAIQPKLRYLLREVIPAVGDWGHVDEIWPKVTGEQLLDGRTPEGRAKEWR